MPFPVEFFTFSKNTNSTSRPGGGASVFNCELIEDTDILSPVIVLNTPGNPTRYNYAHIAEFNRYYFVRNWSWYNGRWSAHLAVDVFASWKPEIGGLEEYVLRAASRSDPYVLDMMYPLKGGYTMKTVSADIGWAETKFADGYYVVGIINDAVNGIGAVSYYVFTDPQFRQFMYKLMGDIAWYNVPAEELGEQLLKTQFNPFQYVASCQWYPIKPPMGEEVDDLHFGWWEMTGVSCRRLGRDGYSGKAVQFTIPKHPETTTRGWYLNLAPYSSYVLDFSPFGQIDIDPTMIINSPLLYAGVFVDYVSGKGTLRITPDSQAAEIIGVVETQFGVPIQLAQISSNFVAGAANLVSSVGQTIGAFASGNVIGGVASAASGVASTALSTIPQSQTKGSSGNLTAFKYPPTLVATFREVVGEDVEHRGRPLCEKVRLGSLTGYIMTSDADVRLPATDAEISLIKQGMNSGFFFE